MTEKLYSLERFFSTCAPKGSLERTYAAATTDVQTAATAVRAAQTRLRVLDRQRELAQQLWTQIAGAKRARAQLQSELAGVTDRRLEELQRQVELWEQASGARIRVTDKQELRIYFSRFNEEVSRDCYLTLDASSEDIWEIKDCQPTIPGLQRLLDTLNETKDLGKFCRSVREGFKATV